MQYGNAAKFTQLGKKRLFGAHKFCGSFDLVVSNEVINPCQFDALNILEPWRKFCTIDEDELVFFICVELHMKNVVFKAPLPFSNAGRRNW